MNKIQILDCTLRDGGYCNEWDFGFDNVKRIISGLVEANVEIVECGFLTDRVNYDPDITRFSDIDQLKAAIPQNRDGKLFVAMVNYGEYDPNAIPDCDGTSVDGFRVAFHKKNLTESLELCRKIKDKGYLVVDGKGQLLMPNFVCAHSHIYSIFARGLSLPFDPHNFQEILDQMWMARILKKEDKRIGTKSGRGTDLNYIMTLYKDADIKLIRRMEL